MKRNLIIFTLLLSLNGFAQENSAKHVVLISIDGFRPDFYLEPSWGMVNLRHMMENGVCALGVYGVFPTLTFPNHTSIVTGVRPGKHGILYNSPFNPEESGEWYWYSKDIKVPTLWDAIRKSGRKTAAVNWPVSTGETIDYNIPIIKKSGKSQLQATTEYSYPKGLMEEVQEYATGKLDNNTYNTNKDYLVIDENVARIAGYLIKKYKPALTTVRLSAVDHFEHEDGRDGHMARAAVAGADRAIRSLIESIDQAGLTINTVIIVTGDHGFVNAHTALAPNVWLKNAGLCGESRTDPWKAQFVIAGGAAFLRLKDPSDQQTAKMVMELINQLPVKDRKLFRVFDKKQLDSAEVDPDAMLALSAVQGIKFSGSFKTSPVKVENKGTHGYFPDFKEIQTGFVAYGAGIRKGLVVPVMELIDIAPLVAEILNIDFNTAEGQFYPGFLDPDKN